jgi:hypothetical protein
MTLEADQHRALDLLAKAGTLGCTETMVQAHGFKLYTVADLVRAGFASTAPEMVRAGSKAITVIRIRITEHRGGPNHRTPVEGSMATQNVVQLKPQQKTSASRLSALSLW